MKKQTGRAPILTSEVRRAVADLVARGLSEAGAARVAGVDPSALRHCKHRNELFAQMIERARAERTQYLLTVIETAATRIEDPEWRAAAWLLERTERESFGAHTAPALEAPGTGPSPEVLQEARLIADHAAAGSGRTPDAGVSPRPHTREAGGPAGAANEPKPPPPPPSPPAGPRRPSPPPNFGLPP
jgi:hypothetical protein